MVIIIKRRRGLCGKKSDKCFDAEDITKLAQNRRSPLGIDKATLEKATHLILAHHTSTNCISKIKAEGLICRKDGNCAIEDGSYTDKGSVYLSSRVDSYYCDRAIEAHGGKRCIIIVEVEKSALEEDENAIASKSLLVTKIDKLVHSLSFGACKFRGNISKNQLKNSLSLIKGSCIKNGRF